MTLERKALPASARATGWLCVVLGGLILLSAAMLALAGFMRRALEEQGVDPFAPVEGSLDPLSRMILRNLAALSVVQAVLGIATMVIGIGFLRLLPWGRIALEILAWLTLAASVLSGAWGIVAWLSPGDGGASSGSTLEGLFTPVAGMVLTLAQCVACGWILRFLRSPEIRALFRKEAASRGSRTGEGPGGNG